MDPLSFISSSSGLSNLIMSETVPLRKDHPLVHYWTHKEWNKHKDKGDILIVNPDGTTKELSCGIAFLKTVTGDQVSYACAVQFQALACSIWNLIVQNQPNKLPATWGKAGLNITDLFGQEMWMKFPEFALCDNNWKAKALATEYYPSWYKGHKLTGKLIKQEDISHSQSTSPAPVATKKHTLPLEVCQSWKLLWSNFMKLRSLNSDPSTWSK